MSAFVEFSAAVRELATGDDALRERMARAYRRFHPYLEHAPEEHRARFLAFRDALHAHGDGSFESSLSAAPREALRALALELVHLAEIRTGIHYGFRAVVPDSPFVPPR